MQQNGVAMKMNSSSRQAGSCLAKVLTVIGQRKWWKNSQAKIALCRRRKKEGKTQRFVEWEKWRKLKEINREKLPCCKERNLTPRPPPLLPPLVMSNVNIGRESIKSCCCFCMTNDELPTLFVPDKQHKRSWKTFIGLSPWATDGAAETGTYLQIG